MTIQLSPSLIYRITSSDQDFTFLGNTYLSRQIRRDNINSSQEITRNEVQVEMAIDTVLAGFFVARPPDRVIDVVVRRLNPAISVTDSLIIFRGRLINVDFTQDTMTLNLEAEWSSLKRSGLRRTFSPTCIHRLYGPECGILEGPFTDAVTLTSVSGVDLIGNFSVQPDGNFDGGFIRQSNGVTHSIEAHVGNNVTLLVNPGNTLTVGEVVDAVQGCARDTNACENQFANLQNYGGFPFLPNINPVNKSNLF